MPKLREKRSVPKKLIDTWVYKIKDVEIERLEWQENPDPEAASRLEDDRTFDEKYKRTKERVKNRAVHINVYMIKRTEQSEEAPHPLDSVEMEVFCPELNIRLEGTDVVALKDAMWGMLDKKFEINWERFFQVEIIKSRIYGDDGTGMEVVYNDVYKGTTWDGKLLLRKWRAHEYKISPWPGAFKDEKGKVMACIPATEENQAALEEFCSRVDILRERLADFLRPDVIQENLLRLASFALLPPPAPTATDPANGFTPGSELAEMNEMDAKHPEWLEPEPVLDNWCVADAVHPVSQAPEAPGGYLNGKGLPRSRIIGVDGEVVITEAGRFRLGKVLDNYEFHWPDAKRRLLEGWCRCDPGRGEELE